MTGLGGLDGLDGLGGLGGLGGLTPLVAVAAGARGTWSPCGLSMVSAINPFTERARGHRYWLTAAWFGLGSLAGGAVLGLGMAAGAWALRWLTRPPGPVGPGVMALAAVAALVALAADCGTAGFQLPVHPRQVNERWLDGYRRWVYAAGFGAQIGVGFATYIMTAATYLLVVLGVLGQSPAVALAAGAGFGLTRGVAVLLSARATSPAKLLTLHRRLARANPWSRWVVIVVEAGVAGLAGGWWIGYPGLLAVAAVLAGLPIVNRVPHRVVTSLSVRH